jgi:hypothetical protein
VTPAEVAAWTVASRARQGLGPTITDPVILGRLLTLAFADDNGIKEDRAGA